MNTPRFVIRINENDTYDVVDTLYEVVVETHEFATDAESAVYLMNHKALGLNK